MPGQKPITDVAIRMYTMGTGDCFSLKFLSDGEVVFKMLVDCGVWQLSEEAMRPYVKNLLADLEDHVDVLVVTHEHKDHVLGFETCHDQFRQLTADQIWLGWSENDADSKVQAWKQKYGEKKLTLARAATRITAEMHQASYQRQLRSARDNQQIKLAHQGFAKVLEDFATLHVSKTYKGGLEGMRIVKEEMATNNIAYLKPGKVLEDIPGLDGVRIYVLGPPRLWESVKTETGEGDEAYKHNRELDESDFFSQALAQVEDPGLIRKHLFGEAFVTELAAHRKSYNAAREAWRKIDDDWLWSSGTFALRLASLTNNLSLVLAFEFLESGKVMLFPGDAEIGSWKSWHALDWKKSGVKTTIEELLNRVAFYKVAHHLSHNGTARSLGLELMTRPDLVAMATLDYDRISSGWTSTMPNQFLLHDLLEKTKGRLLITNEKGLRFGHENGVALSQKLKEQRATMGKAEKQAFTKAFSKQPLYLEFIMPVA